MLAGQSVEIDGQRARDIETGIKKAISFKDPEGNIVELVAGVDQITDAYGDRDVKPTALNHVVLHAQDRAKLEKFYGGTLGFKLSDTLVDFMTFWRCNANHHSIAFMSVRADHLRLNHPAFHAPLYH